MWGSDSAKIQDGRLTNRQRYRETNVPKYIPTVQKTDIQTDKQNRQKRKTNRPTDRRTASI